MSARIAILAALLITAAATIAACGGGDAHYSLEETRECLQASGLEANEGDADAIADAAGEGGLGVRFEHNFLNLAFDRNSSDAEETEQAYETFGGSDGTLARKGNVTFSWDNTPTDDEEEAVGSCLREEE